MAFKRRLVSERYRGEFMNGFEMCLLFHICNPAPVQIGADIPDARGLPPLWVDGVRAGPSSIHITTINGASTRLF